MTGAIAGVSNALDIQQATAAGLYEGLEGSGQQARQAQSSTLMSGQDTVEISAQGRAAANAAIPTDQA